MNNKIGEIIEKYRKEKDLTQEELAKKLGVSNTAVHKWENGYNLPDIALLEPISKVLNVDMMLLLTTENIEKEEIRPKNKNKRINIFINITILIVLFLSVFITLSAILSSHYNKQINKLKSEQVKVYRFHNDEEDILVKGYLLFNNKENILILEELKYQGTVQNFKANSFSKAELNFYLNEINVFKSIYNDENKSTNDINSIFNTVPSEIKLEHNINNVNPNKIKIDITLICTDEKIKSSITVKLEPVI